MYETFTQQDDVVLLPSGEDSRNIIPSVDPILITPDNSTPIESPSVSEGDVSTGDVSMGDISGGDSGSYGSTAISSSCLYEPKPLLWESDISMYDTTDGLLLLILVFTILNTAFNIFKRR